MRAGRVLKDQFFQFSWRPRAPTLLSKEQEADVVKRLKEFSKRYDEEDSKILEEVRLPHLHVNPHTISRLAFPPIYL